MTERKRAISIDLSEVEVKAPAPTNKLNYINKWYYDDNEFLRDKWNIWYNPQEQNPNKDFDKMMEYYFYEEKSIPETVITVCRKDLKRNGIKKVMKQKFGKRWFITLTSKPEWTEQEAKDKIDKYRTNHFKKYKHIWVEEHGGENGGYHQHILVEGDYFHTGQNLKKTSYYDANINVLRCGSNNGIFEYMNKESEILGDTDYFF